MQDNELPRQELLAKMLRMTTSDNDNVALVAIRKANELLRANGWDWDKLLKGKITIVEDPFKSISDPRFAAGSSHSQGYAPSRPAPSRPAPSDIYNPPPPRTPRKPRAPKPKMDLNDITSDVLRNLQF